MIKFTMRMRSTSNVSFVAVMKMMEDMELQVLGNINIIRFISIMMKKEVLRWLLKGIIRSINTKIIKKLLNVMTVDISIQRDIIMKRNIK